MNQKTHLVIIDPQNDFCDPSGALYVKGAEADMGERLAKFIDQKGASIDKIFVTLDTHPVHHIAHPTFWKNEGDEHPAPFSVITPEDIKSGKWFTSKAEDEPYGSNFVNNSLLVIWPEHCLAGTKGNDVFPALMESLTKWETTTGRKVEFVRKGMNSRTEQFSVFKAAVPVKEDPRTELNIELIEKIADADSILFAGEASSHCVKSSVEDFVATASKSIDKLVILKDTMSAVPGFEKAETDFFDHMTKLGVKITTTDLV